MTEEKKINKEQIINFIKAGIIEGQQTPYTVEDVLVNRILKNIEKG
jgi:hypothetical protein